MKIKTNFISANSNYKQSNWTKFLRCWKSRYVDIHGALNGSIISKHEIDGGSSFDSNQLQEKLELDLPKSFLDFMNSYNPNYYWANGKIDNFDAFVLPPSMVEFLPKFDPVSFKIWMRESQEASDADYYVYGLEQNDAVFRSYQYEHLIVVGKTAESDLIMLNPCVRTSDGEMEVILHAPAAIIRTLSFAAMMKSMYCYECEDTDSYPPYSGEMLNNGCASLIVAADPISRVY